VRAGVVDCCGCPFGPRVAPDLGRALEGCGAHWERWDVFRSTHRWSPAGVRWPRGGVGTPLPNGWLVVDQTGRCKVCPMGPEDDDGDGACATADAGSPTGGGLAPAARRPLPRDSSFACAWSLFNALSYPRKGWCRRRLSCGVCVARPGWAHPGRVAWGGWVSRDAKDFRTMCVVRACTRPLCSWQQIGWPVGRVRP
jgi:hypothetical protein